jgi:hypothetical protein
MRKLAILASAAIALGMSPMALAAPVAKPATAAAAKTADAAARTEKAAKTAKMAKATTAAAAAAPNPNKVTTRTSTGKTITYDCSKAGNKTKAACKGKG